MLLTILLTCENATSMQILTLGLNHHTAPVEVRERLAFPENDQPQALTRLLEEYGLSEAAILSTCNRSEL